MLFFIFFLFQCCFAGFIVLFGGSFVGWRVEAGIKLFVVVVVVVMSIYCFL